MTSRIIKRTLMTTNYPDDYADEQKLPRRFIRSRSFEAPWRMLTQGSDPGKSSMESMPRLSS
jgi:hypothetical protein